MRFSNRREAIISYLHSTGEHPTAEAVYQHILPECPNVSRRTVYRNLSQLCESGIIARITTKDGISHFDGDTSPHYHFVCESCGRITDLPMTPLKDLERIAAHDVSGTVTGHEVLFFGRCAACEAMKGQPGRDV